MAVAASDGQYLLIKLFRRFKWCVVVCGWVIKKIVFQGLSIV